MWSTSATLEASFNRDQAKDRKRQSEIHEKWMLFTSKLGFHFEKKLLIILISRVKLCTNHRLCERSTKTICRVLRCGVGDDWRGSSEQIR